MGGYAGDNTHHKKVRKEIQRVCLAGGQVGAGAPVWGWPVMRPGAYSRWVDPAPLEVHGQCASRPGTVQ